MKDTVKLVINHFFIISVGVLFIVAISNTFEGSKPLSAEVPWQVLLTGIAGALPTFLFYFKNEPTKKQFIARTAVHFVLIETIIMTVGRLFSWYDNLIEALLFFAVVLAVYLFVWLYSYFMNMYLAKDINSALKRFNKDEDYDDM